MIIYNYFKDVKAKNDSNLFKCWIIHFRDTLFYSLFFSPPQVALGDSKELLDADYSADQLPSGKHSIKGLGQTAPDPKNYVALWDDISIFPFYILNVWVIIAVLNIFSRSLSGMVWAYPWGPQWRLGWGRKEVTPSFIMSTLFITLHRYRWGTSSEFSLTSLHCGEAEGILYIKHTDSLYSLRWRTYTIVIQYVAHISCIWIDSQKTNILFC